MLFEKFSRELLALHTSKPYNIRIALTNSSKRAKTLTKWSKSSFSTDNASMVKYKHQDKTKIPSQHRKATSSKYEYLFGVGPCYLALKTARRTVFKIFIKDGAVNTARPEFMEIRQKAEELGLPILPATKKKLLALSGGRPAQNIVMEVSPLQFSRFDKFEDDSLESNLQDKSSNYPELWLALDQVQDPMNFGAILRTCSLLGVSRVIVPQLNSAPLSPVVSKASAGAMEVMKIFQLPNLGSFLQERANKGWETLGAVHPIGSERLDLHPISCTDYNMNKPTILVLGNEGTGLQHEVLQHCTQLISIFPTLSLTNDSLVGPDSFNVSVAAGILVFSILKNRQRVTQRVP